MKICFSLKESIYDCKLEITDIRGCRSYLISPVEVPDPCLSVEIDAAEFDLSVTPLMGDVNAMVGELEVQDWKDKLAQKAVKVMLSAFDKMILRVGCRYHIRGLRDGDRLELTMVNYTFGTFDRLDLLELLPVMYMFFQASGPKGVFVPLDAWQTNRREVVKAAKMLALTDALGNGLLWTLFSYPIQVGRVKHLTKNRKMYKVLSKFYNMSEEKRRKIMERQEKFMQQ